MAVNTYVVPSTKIVHETKVDFSYRNVSKPIHIVQYDKQLPIVAVTLYVSGKPYTLPANMDVNIKLGKKDRTFVYNPVLGCNAERTVVYFEVDPQMTYYPGDVDPILELVFLDGGVSQKAGSSPIPITIDRNPIQETDIESSNEYLNLNRAVEAAQAAQEAAEEAESDAVAAAALSAQEAANAEIAKQQAQGAQVAAEAARDELEQTIIEVNRIDERLKDHDAELALKLDKPVGTFDVTRKTVNDITAKYENEIVTGSKATIKGLLGKSAHLKNIYNHGLTIKGRTEGKGKVAYVNKTIDEPIAELNWHTLREVFEGGNLVPSLSNPTEFIYSNATYQLSGDWLILTSGSNTTYWQIGKTGLNIPIGKIYQRFDYQYLSDITYLLQTFINPPILSYSDNNNYDNMSERIVSNIYDNDVVRNSAYILTSKAPALQGYQYKIKDWYLISLDTLGISPTTDMDYYFSLYQARKNITKKVLTYTDIFETFNLVLNPDMSLTTGWNTLYGTQVFENGKLKQVSTNETLEYSAYTSSFGSNKNGHRYYISSFMRTLDVAYGRLRIQKNTSPFTAVYGNIENSPLAKNISSLVTVTFDGDFRVFVSTVKNLATDIRTTYIDDVFGIDTEIFDESITKELLDTFRDYYIEHRAHSLYHVSNPEIKTSNKNLYNYENDNVGYYLNNGDLVGAATVNTSDYIKVMPSTIYTMSKNGTLLGLTKWFYDIDKIAISVNYDGSFTTPSNAHYFRFDFARAEHDNTLLQVEEGSVVTQYVPNLNNTISFPVSRLSALDNGVSDMIHHVNGKWYYEKRIEKYTLQASDINTYDTTVFNNVDYLSISYGNISDYIFAGIGDTPPNRGVSLITTFSKPALTSFTDDLSYTTNHYSNGGDIAVIFPKGTYASLAEAQADLAGTVIYYQLATPVITETTPTGDMIKSPITHVIQQQELPTEISLPNLITTSERMDKFDITNYRDLINTRYYLDGNASVMLDLQQLVDEKQISAATKVAYETWLEANTTLKVGDYFDEFKHDLKLRKYKSISENLLPSIPEMPDDIYTPVTRLNGKTLKEVFEDSEIIQQGFLAVDALTDNIIFQTPYDTSGGDKLYWRITHSGMNSNLRNTIATFGINTDVPYGYENSMVDSGTYSGIFTTTYSNNLIGWWIHTPNISVGFSGFKVYDLKSLGISSLTVSEMDYWYNVYDYLKNGTQITVLKQQLPIKPSTKLNFGYNGMPTELRMEYLDRFDNVISSEVKTTFLGTAYKYGNFTVPATAVKVNAYIKPSELITGPFIAGLKAFIKFDEVNGSPLTNPNKYMWTPYEEDAIEFDQTLRKLVNNYNGGSELNLIPNGNFVNGNTGWLRITQEELSLRMNKMTVIKTPTDNRYFQPQPEITLLSNDVYYLALDIDPKNNLMFYPISFMNGYSLLTEKKKYSYLNTSSGPIYFYIQGGTGLNSTFHDITLVNLSELVRSGIISAPTKEAFEAIQDELDLESLNLIKRLDDNGAVLAEPVVTPVPAQDYDAIVYNYGMELFELESSIIGDITMSYYRDTATQVDTSISLIEDIMARIEALEALHN